MRVSYRQSATDTSPAFRATPSGRWKNIKAFTILNSRSFFRPIVFKKGQNNYMVACRYEISLRVFYFTNHEPIDKQW